MTYRTMSRTFATMALLILPALTHAQSTGAMQEKDKMKKDADKMSKMDDKTLENYDTLVLWSKSLNMAVGTARFDGASHARR